MLLLLLLLLLQNVGRALWRGHVLRTGVVVVLRAWLLLLLLGELGALPLAEIVEEGGVGAAEARGRRLAGEGRTVRG